MQTKYKVALAVLIVVSAFAAGRITSPSKIQEKEVIKYVDKIVEKKVYVKDTQKKNDKITITLTTIKPDGTKTIEKKVIDKGELVINQSGTTDKDQTTTVDSEKNKLTETKKVDTIVSIMGTTNSYGLQIQSRVLGPFYLGAFGFNNGTFGGSVGLGF